MAVEVVSPEQAAPLGMGVWWGSLETPKPQTTADTTFHSHSEPCALDTAPPTYTSQLSRAAGRRQGVSRGSSPAGWPGWRQSLQLMK